jgi:predicted RNA-binding Zn-ribbon protein involved in translation (DUF1610 family)
MMINPKKELTEQECPQCGYLYMDYYEQKNHVRFICPDCGHDELRRIESGKNSAEKRRFKNRLVDK